ncbi:hypothetical protein NL676_013561 [Syzygium grande]|nr:hypothetical protein NL676_013561 [Syzygium grande]
MKRTNDPAKRWMVVIGEDTVWDGWFEYSFPKTFVIESSTALYFHIAALFPWLVGENDSPMMAKDCRRPGVETAYRRQEALGPRRSPGAAERPSSGLQREAALRPASARPPRPGEAGSPESSGRAADAKRGFTRRESGVGRAADAGRRSKLVRLAQGSLAASRAGRPLAAGEVTAGLPGAGRAGARRSSRWQPGEARFCGEGIFRHGRRRLARHRRGRLAGRGDSPQPNQAARLTPARHFHPSERETTKEKRGVRPLREKKGNREKGRGDKVAKKQEESVRGKGRRSSSRPCLPRPAPCPLALAILAPLTAGTVAVRQHYRVRRHCVRHRHARSSLSPIQRATTTAITTALSADDRRCCCRDTLSAALYRDKLLFSSKPRIPRQLRLLFAPASTCCRPIPRCRHPLNRSVELHRQATR